MSSTVVVVVDPALRDLVTDALDALRPLLSDRRREDVDAWLEGQERWLALEQALGAAVAERVVPPADLLNRLSREVSSHIETEGISPAMIGSVGESLASLGAPLHPLS